MAFKETFPRKSNENDNNNINNKESEMGIRRGTHSGLFSSWLLSQACETLGKEHFRQREEQMLRPQVPFSWLEYGVSLYTIKCL